MDETRAEMARMMAEMMRQGQGRPGGMGPGGGPGGMPGAQGDPAERGHQRILAGLEQQLQGVADLIRETNDPDEQAELLEEFRSLANRIVKARREHRDAQIRRLERQLAELRRQEDQEETVSEMEDRMVGESLVAPGRRERSGDRRADPEFDFE
jgi:hypothetical protein